MKKILSLFLLGLAFHSSAQTITGIVANQKDKMPVEFAPVALLRLPDSTLVNSSTTESGGLYKFQNVKPGNYYLKATFVGFAPAGEDLTVTNENRNPVADTIFLKEVSKEIEEVVVIGEKIKGKELVDRTVYSIPGEVSKASPNAYDLLKKIPAITVDYNDNVSLNGSSNFIIQVDGKQRDKEFLARLQPSDIESIEVINNPSGKYEGNIDGVINIKLKRESRFGYSGNINLAARPAKQTSASAAGSLDYSMGNATAYVSGYGFYNDLSTDFTSSSHIFADDSLINTNGTGTYRFSAGSVNSGIDYFRGKYETFSLNLNYKPVTNVFDMDQNSSILLSSYPMYTQSYFSKDSSVSHEINTSFFYKRQFEKPIQEFTTEISYYNFISDGKTRLNKLTVPNTIYNDTVFRLEDNENNRYSFNLKTDYVHPINMDTKFETGVQVYRQQMDFNADYHDKLLLNKYKYIEFRAAAYAGLSVNIDNLGIQGTLRVENSNIDVNDIISDQYFTVLPSANIMYKFNSKHNVKFTYNRRINRPNISQLNPFEKVGFSDDISSGNPVLKPEYRDRLQMTYTMNIKKSYIAPYAYYEMYSGKIDEYSFIGFSQRLQKETFIRTPGNLLSGTEKGVGLNAMILFININFRYFEGQLDEYKNSLTPIASRKYSSYSIGGWAFAPLPWKMNWFAFANYSGQNVTAQGTMQTPFFYGTGLRKDIGNHTIGMFYLLPFISRLTVHDNVRSTPNFVNKEKATFDSSYFIQVQYSYKFNKGKAAKKVQRQAEVESDSKKGALGGPQ